MTSPEDVIRMPLVRSEDHEAILLERMLDTFPAEIVIPVHHNPVVGLNDVLSGVAESQYEGQPMRLLKTGDRFDDHGNRIHSHFRNPELDRPVMIPITHILKRDQSFVAPGRA